MPAAPCTSLPQPVTRTRAELSCPPHHGPGSSGQSCGRTVRPAHSGSRDSSPPHNAAGSSSDFSALPTPPAGTCAGRGGRPGCRLRAGSLARGSGWPSASWALPPPFLPPSRAFTSCCLMSQLRVTGYPGVSTPVGAPRRAGVSRLGWGRAPVCTHGGWGLHGQQHEVSVAWKLKAGMLVARSRQEPSGPAPSAPPAGSRGSSAAEKQPQAQGGGCGEQSRGSCRTGHTPAGQTFARRTFALRTPETASGRLGLPGLQHQGATFPAPDPSWEPAPHPFFPESSVFNLAGQHPGPRLRTPAPVSLPLLPNLPRLLYRSY